MYTEVFLGDAPAAAKPWIDSHVAARKTVFTLTDGTQVSADIVGELDKDTVAQHVPDTSLLKEVIVGSTVSALDNSDGQSSTGTFFMCSNLKKVMLQRDTAKIDSSTFEACTSLEEVVLPNSISSIGNDAFKHCTSLKKLDIPLNVKLVGDGTFHDCQSLEEVVFEKNIQTIAREAFDSFPVVKKLVFKHKTMEEVKAIDDFSTKWGLSNHTMLEAIDGVFYFEQESSGAEQLAPSDIVGPGGTNS